MNAAISPRLLRYGSSLPAPEEKWDSGPSANVRARQHTEAMAVHFSVVNRVKGKSLTPWYQMKKKKKAR